MTTPKNKADDGVHRLVDMVVEEVSLVDRAANKHRFLIVKRDDAMDDDNTTDTTTNEPAPSAAPTAKLDDGTALSAALTALESQSSPRLVPLRSSRYGETVGDGS